MRINLACPFEDRQAVKALGARWDAALKVWYVLDPPDLLPFARWLPLDVGQFLTTAGAEPPAKASPKAKPKKAKASKVRELPPNQGPTNYTPDFVPQDIGPDDPPW